METEVIQDRELAIKVYIGDRPYPLKVEGKEEEIVRKAAKMVNENITQYKENYAADKQDALAMSALKFAVESLKKNAEITGTDSGLADKVQKLELMLDNFLHSNR